MLFCALAFVACSDDPEVTPPSYEEEAVPEVAIAAGEIDETSAEIVLSAKNASHVACMYVLKSYADEIPSALDVFRQGEFSSEIHEGGEALCLLEKLEPGTSYVVYAAARKDEVYGEVKSLEVTTAALGKMLSFVESTKSTFTYRVDVPEGTTYQHAYIEGWYYDYMLELTKRDAGPEFDMNVFLWNLLVDFGFEAEGPQNFFWYAGQENAKRSDVAKIVGGKKYYALFSLYKAENNWLGTPEAVAFETQPAGVSDGTVNLIGEVTPTSVKVRMEVDSEKVNFFFYDLYPKAAFDEMKAVKGEAGMMDYVYEYGYSAANTYTDVWGVEPAKSYMLAILGVDRDGDLFYVEKQYDTEALQPELTVDMRPFERDLRGYHAYDTFEVMVTPANFGEIRTDGVLWMMQPKAVLDATLELFGMSLEQLLEQPEYISYVGAMPLPEDCADQLDKNGFFVTYLSDMNPDTEYCFLCAVPYGESYKVAYATASTEAMPEAGVVDDEYKAYLGEWKLEGQSTEDYYTRKSYTLRFEELTPNRSYKVYGWSDADVAQEFPFEARYHADTKKISIEGHQLLGTRTVNGVELPVYFDGFLSFNGGLQLTDSFTGTVYQGSLLGDRLQMFPNYVVLSGRYYEFCTMAYTAYDAAADLFYGFEEFQIVNFFINRASQTAAAAPLTFAAGAKARVMPSIPWRPETSVRVAAPAVRDASAKQPSVIR